MKSNFFITFEKYVLNDKMNHILDIQVRSDLMDLYTNMLKDSSTEEIASVILSDINDVVNYNDLTLIKVVRYHDDENEIMFEYDIYTNPMPNEDKYEHILIPIFINDNYKTN